MKHRIEEFGQQMKSAINSHPVEVFLAVSACVMGCYDYESKSRYFEMMLQYLPVVFLFAYTLNQLCVEKKKRFVYYLSVLLWVPFLRLPVESPFSSIHMVSLIVVQLIYLASGRQRDNRGFVENGLFYVRSFLSAGVLSGVTFLLAASIYQSIQYIFEVWQDDNDRFMSYVCYIVFCGVFPLLFLMFNQRKEAGWKDSENKLFNILLNYVLSPALLIYVVILYLYFIKITVSWSLPKGAVAYIVVSFTSAAFILKGCQVFLARRYYDWFYNHASLAVLPALAMFWVGTFYRIGEYGFTEARVYLVVVGLILTGTVILFFVKRWACYLYVACWAILLLVSVTYIPGITAKDIERISQTARGNYPMKESLEVEYIHISSDEPIDIRGYNTMESLRDYKTSDVARLQAENDTIAIYDKENVLVYQRSYDDFLDGQLRKVGLSRSDSIPESVYPDLLRIDMDSSAIILEAIDLRRDSVNHISYIMGSCYLKQ